MSSSHVRAMRCASTCRRVGSVRPLRASGLRPISRSVFMPTTCTGLRRCVSAWAHQAQVVRVELHRPRRVHSGSSAAREVALDTTVFGRAVAIQAEPAWPVVQQGQGALRPVRGFCARRPQIGRAELVG